MAGRGTKGARERTIFLQLISEVFLEQIDALPENSLKRTPEQTSQRAFKAT
jgi:hypothetical protein